MSSIETAAEKSACRRAADRHLVSRELENQGDLLAPPNDQPRSETGL